jgi:hypothetical protein
LKENQMTNHASPAAIVEHLSRTTDDVYELMNTDGDDGSPMIYYFDGDSDSHVFIEWAGEFGWLIAWQCSPGVPTSAKLPTSDPADVVKTAAAIAAIRSGAIDEFEAAGAAR